ncbi:bifunctional heparan sulfate N-deacetylase/N-sulfotransferase-like [Babylonia areolata]|uniref:bifunctional heparan sulfate N-deacetylase/N-sulfotransferase-like n=1 Tax=Babylonia areolata TaxID=304850 RepID=UPI003FD67C0E
MALCRLCSLRSLFLKRMTPMRALACVLLLSVFTSVVFFYHLMNFHPFTLHTKQVLSPPQPHVACTPDPEAPPNLTYQPHDHRGKERHHLGHRALIMVETQYTRLGTKIHNLLDAWRIDSKMETVGNNLPTLTHGEKGKFAVIIFENYSSYLTLDSWNRQLLDKYCKKYNVGIIGFVQPKGTDVFLENLEGFPLTVEYNMPIFNYKLNIYSKMWRVSKPGRLYEGVLDGDSWAIFHYNEATYQPLSYSFVHKAPDAHSDSTQTVIKRVVPVIHDTGQLDGIERVLFGGGLDFWMHHMMMMDCLSYLSRGKLSTTLDRYIQIDIDDIFVGKIGTRVKVDDVMAMLSTQTYLQSVMEGFHFNLGFSGRFYLHGDPEEDAGDKKLIEYRHHFWWFGHMWMHEQAHTMDLHKLEASMSTNKQFAKDYSLPVEQHYSVAPHHSGVYPVHEELYTAWRSIWDIKVTSSEEYPSLYPFWRRRGFIHRGIMVLPRQTCGLFTRTVFISDYKAGLADLEENFKGGELFQTVLYSPFNIFMTHMNNYGNDRVALFTFEGLVRFLQCWTNLRLLSVPPLQLGINYFNMFPQDKDPLWQNPCDYKRHINIWSGNKSCERLPKFLVVGPQKTGTTALYTFLSMHPAVMSNIASPSTFEEVQFFNGNNYYKGIDWYMEFFPLPANTSGTLLFEKSATYFDHENVPQRVFSLLPRAKIICILIDPAKRAYSWYQHQRAHNDQVALNYSFNVVLTADERMPRQLRDLRAHCLDPGLYYQNLMNWLDYFPARQLLIIDGEELRNNPIHVMHKLQQFLHIQPYFDYSQHLRFDPHKGFFCQVLSDSRNKCLGRGKGRLYDPMDEASATYLRHFYRKHNVNLSKLLTKLNYPVPTWLQEMLLDDN